MALQVLLKRKLGGSVGKPAKDNAAELCNPSVSTAAS